MKNFKELISPLSLEEFSSEYWGRKGFFLHGAVERYTNLFNWEKFNVILNSNFSPHPAAFTTSAGRRETPKNHEDLISSLQKGNTLVIENVDRYDSTLSEFLNQISNDFIHNTRFNLYLSYPGKAGYLTHYDTHDVFILQIKGTKKWRVFPSTVDDPLFYQKVHGIYKPPDDSIYIDTILEEGSFLYVPRGHWHDAITLDDLSLHLTLAVFPRTGIFFMNWLNDELTENRKFRHNFPLIFPEDRSQNLIPEFSNHIQSLKVELTKFLQDPEMIDRFLDYCISYTKIRPMVNFPLNTLFKESDTIENLTFVRPSKIFRIKKLNDKILIIVGSKKISLSSHCNSFVDFIFSSKAFTFEEVASQSHLSASDLITILKLFISEGIILANKSF